MLEMSIVQQADGQAGREDYVAPPQTFEFRPYDIFSKWGFGDGDLLNEVVSEYAEQLWPGSEDEYWHYLSSHRLLWHAYHRFVARPGDEPVQFVRTSHNPVRAACEWDDSPRVASQPTEDTEPVAVTRAELLALCGELFPPRPSWWLELDRALWGGLWLATDPSLSPLLGGAAPEDPAGGITDQVVERFSLSQEAALLVASLLTSGPYGVWSPRESGPLEDVVATAKATLA